MAKIKYVTGDATYPIGDGNKIIAHVCNDVGAWGYGFVLSLSARWPEPERLYKATKRTRKLELDSIQICTVESDIYVVNMIAQHGLRSSNNPIPLRYDALYLCLVDLKELALEINASIHMPRIGCGLAGGKWDLVEKVINNEFLDEKSIDVFVYDLKTIK